MQPESSIARWPDLKRLHRANSTGREILAGTFSFSQWRTRVTAGIGGIAAIVVGWGMGIFALKSEPPTPALSTGQPIAAGEWALRLDRATVGDRMPSGGSTIGGRKAIVLYLQATNRTAETSSSYLQTIKLDTAIPGVDASPVAYLQRDNALVTDLQPALPEQVALVWTYPAATPPPAKLRFSVTKRAYKAFDNLYAQPGWFDSGTVGVVDLPVSADAMGAVS
jgi:hypothetical protein